MRLFGRSSTRPGASGDLPAGCARPPPAPFAQREGRRGSPVGQYMTDGMRLFRVAHAIRDLRNGAVLLELEDCRTLELVVCSADAIERTPMAPVRPLPVG